jgi:hypothetical protein
MAIDSREKRFSMLNFSFPVPVALFAADGTVDADDRAHTLNLYAGITLDNPSPPTGGLAAGSLSLMGCGI